MGIVKVDLLGLGMMAVLQDALEIINSPAPGAGSREPVVDLAHLPPDDPAVYRMLQAADTIGLFQVESRAQMAVLPRLRPERFYDLVVQVAIIRPGPIVGQMVHPYLNRRAGREDVVYPHPRLEPVLKRTLGVPLFQEQLLRMAMVVAGFTGGQAEELRRAMGFKRSEKRMRQIEVQLREGMARNGITAAAADGIVTSITSFALYGFPESHAASFALLAYASAYLKAHYPAAFYAALLNNQPMGFYHPATLVKDAQRRGVHFAPIDVQVSDWLCTIEPDGAIRLGLMYVHGLRDAVGHAIAAVRPAGLDGEPLRCPKCGCEDGSMIETAGGSRLATGDPPEAASRQPRACFCNICAHDWQQPVGPPGRFASIEDLIRRTGARRDELAGLGAIGALNAFGYDRRGALWQIEQAVRPAGEMFEEPAPGWEPDMSPLSPMTPLERMTADYAGTGLTLGKHPMAMQRAELALRGVQRAVDLPRGRSGQRVRTAGMVITRQRPGTAKGFVFLTLEDETGIANIIVRPDLFAAERMTIVGQPFLVIEGVLQNVDGVTSVKAERVSPLTGLPFVESHDFS
jgi:error-prone DNA polymerase